MSSALSSSATAVSFADLGATDDAPALSAKNSESLLEEFEIEVEEKVKQMRSLTERLALRLDRNFQLELLKLPPSIRSMTMQEFCVQFGGDVDEALKQQAKRSKHCMPPPPPAAAMQPPPTASKEAPMSRARAQPVAAEGLRTNRKANGGGAGAETPQASGAGRASRSRRGAETPQATPGPRGMQTPGGACMPRPSTSATPIWTPRLNETPRFAQRGEIALSQNGSPINFVEGVKATVKRGRAQPVIGFMTANGQEIDLTVEGARAACPDEESRVQALSRLDELEKQVQAIKGELM